MADFITDFQAAKAAFIAAVGATHGTPQEYDQCVNNYFDALEEAEAAHVAPSDPPGHPRRPS